MSLSHALEAIDTYEADDLAKAKSRALIIGYHHRWQNEEWESVLIEEPFHLPIVNAETGRKSQTYGYAGKYDGVIRNGNRMLLRELKTCSEDIEDHDAPYWRRLAIDTQVSLYVLANWQQQRKLDGTLYDVIRKPGIKPRLLKKEEVRVLVSFGTYYDEDVSEETKQEVIAGATRENPELYQIRLTKDCLEQPERYYQRRSVPRLDVELSEFAGELWDIAKEVRHSELNERWYKNSGACNAYGRTCEYLPLCAGHDTEDSDRWARKPEMHPELEGHVDEGLSVLTHSSMQTFKTCRRKYLYKYVRGLERTDFERSESLSFGSLLHEAIAAWWSTLGG